MFDSREMATLLAALLFWKEEMMPHGREAMRPYLEQLGIESIEPLSANEIDRLSARLGERCRQAAGGHL
mgnify:CR=1 FL=1